MGMRWTCLAVIGLLGACATPAGPQARSASPVPSIPVASSPTAAPLSVSTPTSASAGSLPTPTPGTSLIPISPVGFDCRLPFVQQVGAGKWQAGFLTLPPGNFEADPSSPPPGYYDVAVSKWIPVGRNAVAPDGLHYAVMSGGSPSQTPGPPRLHIVAAATGVERVIDLALPDSQPYGVEDYAADGICIGSGWEGAVFGHWRVDPASGRIAALGSGELLLDDGTGHAWRSAVDPRDPQPARSAMSGEPLPNEIVRRDLNTGTDEVWFFYPGFSLAIAGKFVGGGLLVWAEADTSSHPNASHEYWLVSAPGHSQLFGYIDFGGQTMADSHGIWMGSSNGLYLFTLDGGVRRVSDRPGDPENGCL